MLTWRALLAACPEGTTLSQLLQAMARAPGTSDYRQNWDASEFCIRPHQYHRAADWVKVPTAFSYFLHYKKIHLLSTRKMHIP